MARNFDLMRRYLSERATPRGLLEGWAALTEPYFEVSEPRRLGLENLRPWNPRPLAAALSEALGRKIAASEMIGVSAGALAEGRSAGDGAYEAAVAEGLRLRYQDELWSTLGSRLFAVCGPRLRARFAMTRGTPAAASAAARELDRRIGELGGNALVDSNLDRVRDVVGGGRHEVVVNFLAAIMVGDFELAARLKPLVERLAEAVPLGEKGDEPGVWYVLTA